MGCASSTHAPTATVETATPAASPTPPLSSDVGATIENVVIACREKDTALLREFLATPVTDEQIAALFARGRDVVLRSQTPSITGDEASVAVELEITRAAGTERAQRTWAVQRGADGLWRLTALPDCY